MLFDTFLQDLRVGLRVLSREKGFSALAVTILAIGICAVATQYAVVNAALLRSFPFREPDRLVDLQIVEAATFTPSSFKYRMTGADFMDVKARQTSFAQFAGYVNGSTVNFSHDGEPSRLTGAYITHDYFTALGVEPALGRDFRAEEDRPGGPRAVILSDALWHSAFGGDRQVLGRTVRVNGGNGVIVGVMPPGFQFPGSDQIWVPLHAEFPVVPRADPAAALSVRVLGRLKPGVTLDQAQAELSRIAAQLAAEHPDTNRGYTLGHVRPLIRAFTEGRVPVLLYTMLGFCAGVLLIACVNVMNMQFARATLRARELAIRSSLGASRARLMRLMLTENLVLAVLGAAIGVGAAFYATDYLDTAVHRLDTAVPSWMRITIDLEVLAVVAGTTMLAAVASGVVPAWISSQVNPVDVLKESSRGHTSRTAAAVSRSLVILQLAVSAVVLIGALLQTRSIARQQGLDYGYDTGAVLAARVGLMAGDYPTEEKRREFYTRVLQELRQTPGIGAAALNSRLRMVFDDSASIELEGPAARGAEPPEANVEHISPGYVPALGLRLIAGREFGPGEREPVALVNESFARRHFGRQPALGRKIRVVLKSGDQAEAWRTIVGVVSDTRMQSPHAHGQSDASGVFLPFDAPRFGTLVVRPRGDVRPETLTTALRAAVRRVDPHLPLYFVATPRELIDALIGPNRMVGAMFGTFGLVAVLLASVGLYGVTSVSVNQRTQEFGIRMALGADPWRVVGMVLRQGAVQLLLGLGGGLLLALLLASLFRAGLGEFLIGISPHDPQTYLTVAAVLVAVSLLATLVPAWRATRTDPMSALRTE